MKKPIPTAVHGIIDYVSVGTLLALPRMLKWNKKITTLLTGAAIGTLGYSLMTRYELGLLKLLPMKGHLSLDFMSGASLAVAPFLLLDEDERDTAMLSILLGFSAFEISASLLTQTAPSMQEETPIKTITEQVKELVGVANAYRS